LELLRGARGVRSAYFSFWIIIFDSYFSGSLSQFFNKKKKHTLKIPISQSNVNETKNQKNIVKPRSWNNDYERIDD